MKKYLTAAAALVLAIALAGCAGTEKAESRTEQQSQAESHLEQPQETPDSSDSSTSFFAGTEDEKPESSVQPPQSQPPTSSKSTEITRPQAETSGQEQQAPPKAEQQPPEKTEEPAVTPTPEEPPAVEPTPTLPPQEPEPAPAFDVSPYVQYAISYGTSAEVGLILDNTATSCWDDPLTANAKSIYLERDLKDRLDWYKTSGFTRFWVWAEQTGDGEFQVYIGYA